LGQALTLHSSVTVERCGYRRLKALVPLAMDRGSLRIQQREKALVPLAHAQPDILATLG